MISRVIQAALQHRVLAILWVALVAIWGALSTFGYLKTSTLLIVPALYYTMMSYDEGRTSH